MNQAQVVRICPRINEVPIIIHHIVVPVHAVALEVTNHHPSVVVDDVAWAEAHGWWFINKSDSDSLKVGGRSSKLLTLLDMVDLIVMLEFVKMAFPYCSWGDSIASFMPGMQGLTLLGLQCVSWRHRTWQASS